jgi:hypothetical protein
MDAARLVRPAIAGLLGVCVALAAGGLSAAAAAPAKKKLRTTCQQLARSHKDLARSARLVTAVLGGDETGRIAACVLPRGKLRTLAAWDDGLSRDYASVVQTAGTWVLVEEGHGDQYGGTSRSLTRHDVRSGRRLSLSGYGCQVGFGGPSSCTDGTSYGDVALISTGAGGIELTDLATATTTLQAFSPAGVLTKLADGPVEALRARRPQLTWMQDGVAHGAPLPD